MPRLDGLLMTERAGRTPRRTAKIAKLSRLPVLIGVSSRVVSGTSVGQEVDSEALWVTQKIHVGDKNIHTAPKTGSARGRMGPNAPHGDKGGSA